MPRLFISHSSKDDVEALAFRRWLVANGWSENDVFIDLHGIGAGERWRERLRKANAACEAVVLLASPNSLGSVECEKELELAEGLGKPIIPVIVREAPNVLAGTCAIDRGVAKNRRGYQERVAETGSQNIFGHGLHRAQEAL